MLSIYLYSLGREVELSGAPAVFLPREVRPLPLGEALARLSEPEWYLPAIWRLIRGLPPERDREGRSTVRYPRELVERVPSGVLGNLQHLRDAYRAGSHLLAAALAAIAATRWDQAKELLGLLGKYYGSEDRTDVSRATTKTLGFGAADLVRHLLNEDRGTASQQLSRLEAEVGLDLTTFVTQLADVAAFLEVTPEVMPRRGDARDWQSVVYPVSLVIRQDTHNLTTTATVTTLVTGTFDRLRTAVDPRCWPLSSSVIRSTSYVRDAFRLEQLRQEEAPPIGEGSPDRQLLHEVAALDWGAAQGAATFDNVLRIDRHVVEPEREVVTVEYSLGRSIESTVLWDRRNGGLLVDEGYLKVRPFLPGQMWRVTTRKVVRFSDRTPSAYATGWRDFGQVLNYLAPAALSWWLESELYTINASQYTQPDEAAALVYAV